MSDDTSSTSPSNSFHLDDDDDSLSTTSASASIPTSITASPHSTTTTLPSTIEFHRLNGESSTQQYIKRPLNAYMIWTVEQRAKIPKGTHQKMNAVVKNLGEIWKKMSDKEKAPYFERAKKQSDEHKRALLENPNLSYAPPKKKACHVDTSRPLTPAQSESPVPSMSPAPNGYVYNHNGFPVLTAGLTYTPNGIPVSNATRINYYQSPSGHLSSQSNVRIVPAVSNRQPQTPQQHQPGTILYYDPTSNTYTSQQAQQSGSYQNQAQQSRMMAPPPPVQQQQPSYHQPPMAAAPDDSQLTSAQICERYYAALTRPMFQSCFESPSNLRDPNYYYDLHIQLFNRPL